MELVRKYNKTSVFILFTLIAVVFTFPLVLKINSEIPKGGGDTYQSLANIDSRTEILKSEGFVNGLKTLAAGNNLNTYLPYVILNLFFNKFASYNIWFILSFILSGFGAYLLAFYFTRNRLAAFLAGLIFAFSPFHWYQSVAVHLGTMQQQWLPFFALFLFKFFEKFEFKHFAGAAVFGILIAISEHQMLAFTGIFVGIFLVYKFATEREIFRNKKFWIYIGCSAAILVFLAFFLFAPLLKVAFSEKNFLSSSIGSAKKYSMRALDPLVPPPFHSLWPGASDSIQKVIFKDINGRDSYFTGFSVLAVLVFFFIRLKKERKEIYAERPGNKKNIWFWLIMTGSFYVFSLGPAFNIGKTSISLPYYLIYKFAPFYGNIRTTGRLYLFAMLGISVLFAYGFALLLRKFKNRELLFSALAAVVIMLEFSVLPIPTQAVTYSAFYDQIAKDGGKYKLLEIPGSTNYEFASYVMYTGNIHKKEVLNGMPLARVIKDQFKMQRTTPVIKQLLYTLPDGHDPEKNKTPDYFKDANKILSDANVGYITINKKFLKQVRVERSVTFIEKYIRYDSKYEDEDLIAYRISS